MKHLASYYTSHDIELAYWIKYNIRKTRVLRTLKTNVESMTSLDKTGSLFSNAYVLYVAVFVSDIELNRP